MIASNHIGRSIESARQYLVDHPDEARYTDTAASAVIEGGLRCRVDDPNGATVYTDMPNRGRRRVDCPFARLLSLARRLVSDDAEGGSHRGEGQGGRHDAT
jgi:hypothetical protein